MVWIQYKLFWNSFWDSLFLLIHLQSFELIYFYKKDITINTLGPVGDKVEEWTIKGAFCTAVDFGTLDWSTGDPLNVNLTVAYDYAILQY